MPEERLQKIIAHAGITSRRAAESLIEQGRVTVNGTVAKIGQSGDPKLDEIRVDGIRVELPDSYEYIILNKPRGVISDVDVSGDHANARDLIPLDGHLYPVGRLDLMSEGLMLFTNDGDLAHKLTHPRYEHPKTYQVVLAGSITVQAIDRWRSGVIIEGKKTRPAIVTKIQKTRDGTVLEVTMREGRKRQIRKIASALGYPVISLTRTRLGPLSLGELPEGGWRRLSPEEIQVLVMVRRSPEPKRSRTSTSASRASGASKRPQSQKARSGLSNRAKSTRAKSRSAKQGGSSPSHGSKTEGERGQARTNESRRKGGSSDSRTGKPSHTGDQRSSQPAENKSGGPQRESQTGRSQRPAGKTRRGDKNSAKPNQSENERP